mmetsp:Transcript_1402/g.1334  ORF Transcript_1402/g.1334 Transcript_1402/m.1334 type:complete len:110 (-) Transcript_1402:209-538(-)
MKEHVQAKKAFSLGPKPLFLMTTQIFMPWLKAKGGKIILLENLTSSADRADNHSNMIYADNSSVGRPLGGKFLLGMKILYFADVLVGLCRVNLANEYPKIELVATEVKI